jgi:hypothetical protein
MHHLTRNSPPALVLVVGALVAFGVPGSASALSPVSCGDLPKPDRVKCLPPEVNRTNHRHGPGHQHRGKHRRNHRSFSHKHG